ncbi:MAG TPA: stalk domain-containing protein [Armatimonadota bacterium]|nr:stalk domain-containing protein [Armatimonadota bacterium]
MRSIAITLVLTLIAAYIPIPVYAETGWVSIVSPSAGESLTGQRAEVSISFNTGTSEKITRVELDVDGTPYGVKNLREPVSRGITSFLIDTTKLGNGPHKFVVRVYSGSKLIGSTSGSHNIGNVPIDVIGPDVVFTGIKKGQVVSGTTTIELSAKDNVERNPMVSLFIDKTLKLIKNTPPYTYAWDTTQYNDGRHTLEACAYDAAGNKGEAQAVEVIVRNSDKQVLAADPATDTKEPVKTDDVRVVKSVDQPVEPIIPVEKESNTASARSTDSKATLSSGPNTVSAKPDRPVVKQEPIRVVKQDTVVQESQPVAVDPVVDISDTVDKTDTPDLPIITEPTPAVETSPAVTSPSVAETKTVTREVMAALPSGIASPVITERPSIEPIITPAKERPSFNQSELQKVDFHLSSAQKLSRPQVPVISEPVTMAMAPEPVLPAAQPSLEPHKVKLTLHTAKLGGTLVTELRCVIESAGGVILSWDNQTKTVLAMLDGKKIRIKVGSRTADIDGSDVKLTNAPYINSNGRTVVDVRFLKSLLGTRLVLDEQTGKYTLISG